MQDMRVVCLPGFFAVYICIGAWLAGLHGFWLPFNIKRHLMKANGNRKYECNKKKAAPLDDRSVQYMYRAYPDWRGMLCGLFAE